MARSRSKSRKRSAASSSSHAPPEFFIDRSLGRLKVAAALRAAGFGVHVHDDYFPPATKDHQWLSALAGRGWVVLTADQRIRYNSVEREALMAAHLQTFVLTSAAFTGDEAGAIFAAATGQMIRLCQRHAGQAFIAKVSRGPDVRLLFGPR